MKGANENSLRDNVLNGGLRDLNPLRDFSSRVMSYAEVPPKGASRSPLLFFRHSLPFSCRAISTLHPSIACKCTQRRTAPPCNKTNAYGTSRHIQGTEFLTGEPNLVIATGRPSNEPKINSAQSRTHKSNPDTDEHGPDELSGGRVSKQLAKRSFTSPQYEDRLASAAMLAKKFNNSFIPLAIISQHDEKSLPEHKYAVKRYAGSGRRRKSLAMGVPHFGSGLVPRADQSNIITSFHSFNREGQSMRTVTQGASVPAGDGGGLQTPVEVSKRVLGWVRQQIVDTRTEENGGVREGERHGGSSVPWLLCPIFDKRPILEESERYEDAHSSSGRDVRVVQVMTTFWNRPSTQVAKSSPEHLGRALRGEKILSTKDLLQRRCSAPSVTAACSQNFAAQNGILSIEVGHRCPGIMVACSSGRSGLDSKRVKRQPNNPLEKRNRTSEWVHTWSPLRIDESVHNEWPRVSLLRKIPSRSSLAWINSDDLRGILMPAESSEVPHGPWLDDSSHYGEGEGTESRFEWRRRHGTKLEVQKIREISGGERGGASVYVRERRRVSNQNFGPTVREKVEGRC
ncbi:hypothetical protein EDD85DRAFT_783133 [Armillaria nabsnona]|nr:hypothetical protein EDD85DRAFT_783133 [Armillaria nabsnona]